MEDDNRLFAALWSICDHTRHGTVDGIEFDLRHPELDPKEWDMPYFFGTRSVTPSIWFPWSDPFDEEANIRDSGEIYKSVEVFVHAGDKVVIDEVSSMPLGDSFSHTHDAMIKLATLRVIRKDGQSVRLHKQLKCVGRTSIFASEEREDQAFDSIASRILSHFNSSICDLDELVISNSWGFAEAALYRLQRLKPTKRELLSTDDEERLKFLVEFALNHAALMGYYWANAEAEMKMKPLAKSGLQLRESTSKAGKASGSTRRAKAAQTWQAHARELAHTARNSHPTWSQNRIADEISALWKLESEAPAHATLTLFISQLERDGVLPRRQVA